ncbi:MAG: MBL fold metallo-hydrolase [Candidatus Bathyarchaeota archaeon]|nr:MBL fold metallo-hydrolase [Candidatus Bathyarchaeota archaeon]
MKIRFLGGTREVGRSALLAMSENTKILLDYGVMFDHQPGFPMHVQPKVVDAVVMTHSHLDHSGAIPVFHIHEKIPVFGTKLSFDLVQLLISDFIHLSGYYLPFEYIELQTMLRSCVHLDYREQKAVGDVQIQLLDAGHLPGSAQILVEAEGKRLLYTSDYNLTETRLLHGADKEYGELDALIIESTYADEVHPDRNASEKEFVENLREVVENGGTVLVPAFGVGRSQEIVCILAAHHFDHLVTIDGMTRKTNRILMDHTSFLRDPRLFMDAVHSATWVEGWRDRRKAPKKPGVIVSPAGMLKGGPAAFYVQKLGKKSRNAIFLVSYQIPGTPGRELMEKGRCVIDGKMQKVKAKVERFDFSSHCGASELQETVKRLEGNPKVYVVHGAEGNCTRFAKWVKKEVGFEASAPRSGDTFTI